MPPYRFYSAARARNYFYVQTKEGIRTNHKDFMPTSKKKVTLNECQNSKHPQRSLKTALSEFVGETETN